MYVSVKTHFDFERGTIRMKKYAFKGFSLVLAVALIITCFSGCAKINYVTDGAIQAINEIKDGSWKEDKTAESTGENDPNSPVIDALTPGTYGGVKMDTIEDVVKYYVEAYNYSKGLTAQYKNSEGGTETWYKLLGEEKLSVSNILIDGSSNAVIEKMVPGIVDGIYSPGLNGLPPCRNRTPEMDVDDNNESLQTSRLTADDLVAANVKDNGDGTITIQMQPKAAEMSSPGLDAQGHMFTSLGAIDSVVDSIGALKWSQGTTADNCKVNYYGGTATVTINTSTKEITSAEYIMKAFVNVTHASIAVITDKSASIDITYTVKYPASDKYLMDSKQCSRL